MIGIEYNLTNRIPQEYADAHPDRMRNIDTLIEAAHGAARHLGIGPGDFNDLTGRYIEMRVVNAEDGRYQEVQESVQKEIAGDPLKAQLLAQGDRETQMELITKVMSSIMPMALECVAHFVSSVGGADYDKVKLCADDMWAALEENPDVMQQMMEEHLQKQTSV